MKNIFQFHTDEPSKLQLQMNGKLHYENGTTIALRSNQFLYIVDAKQTIEDTNWFIDTSYNFAGEVVRLKGELRDTQILHCYKIIMSNDPKLVEDGIQEIPNEFLKWYVNNPTEGVLVQYMQYRKKWFYHLRFEASDRELFTKLNKSEGEGNMISDWLREHSNPKIDAQVEEEAIYLNANQFVDGGRLIPKAIKGGDRCKVVDLIFDAYVQGAKSQEDYIKELKQELQYFRDKEKSDEERSKGLIDALQAKYDTLCKAVTELQEKYDENGYNYPPEQKIQRVTQHIDHILNQHNSK